MLKRRFVIAEAPRMAVLESVWEFCPVRKDDFEPSIDGREPPMDALELCIDCREPTMEGFEPWADFVSSF